MFEKDELTDQKSVNDSLIECLIKVSISSTVVYSLCSQPFQRLSGSFGNYHNKVHIGPANLIEWVEVLI